MAKLKWHFYNYWIYNNKTTISIEWKWKKNIIKPTTHTHTHTHTTFKYVFNFHLFFLLFFLFCFVRKHCSVCLCNMRCTFFHLFIFSISTFKLNLCSIRGSVVVPLHMWIRVQQFRERNKANLFAFKWIIEESLRFRLSCNGKGNISSRMNVHIGPLVGLKRGRTHWKVSQVKTQMNRNHLSTSIS